MHGLWRSQVAHGFLFWRISSIVGVGCLVAPYCAIPRDYLSDTPYCALWGFWCLNMPNWVRYPLPFSVRFPLGEHAKRRCDSQKGYLSDTCAIPHENKAMGAIPSAILSRQGIARYGGVSQGGVLCLTRNTLCGRVLRRFLKSKCSLEGFLEDTCMGFQYGHRPIPGQSRQNVCLVCSIFRDSCPRTCFGADSFYHTRRQKRDHTSIPTCPS